MESCEIWQLEGNHHKDKKSPLMVVICFSRKIFHLVPCLINFSIYVNLLFSLNFQLLVNVD